MLLCFSGKLLRQVYVQFVNGKIGSEKDLLMVI